MLRRALLVSVLLFFALGCLVPGFGEGLSLCIEQGPDGHFAIERGPCGSASTRSACAPATGPAPALDRGTCDACFDIPLGTTGPVRLSPPTAALPVPAAAEHHLLPAAADAPAAPLSPAPPPGTRTPVRLRI